VITQLAPCPIFEQQINNLTNKTHQNPIYLHHTSNYADRHKKTEIKDLLKFCRNGCKPVAGDY